MNELLTGNYFDGSPFIDDITIFRGELLQGNHLSIKESDNLPFKLRSSSAGSPLPRSWYDDANRQAIRTE